MSYAETRRRGYPPKLGAISRRSKRSLYIEPQASTWSYAKADKNPKTFLSTMKSVAFPRNKLGEYTGFVFSLDKP
jgi:hypothetical protein